MICLPSYRYSGPMKPTTVLTSSGSKRARHRVGARLAGLLVHAVMRVGRQAEPWPVSKYITLLPDRAALQRQRRLPAPRASRARLMPKLLLAASVPAMDWKIRSTGAPRCNRLQLRGHMRQHAGLRGDLVPSDQLIHHPQQRRATAHAVRGRIDADHRVAAAVEQAVENRGGNAPGIVGRMIRLQPNGQPARQTERAAKRASPRGISGPPESRSWLLINFATAAAISGRDAGRHAVPARCESVSYRSSHSRNCPTVSARHRRERCRGHACQ